MSNTVLITFGCSWTFGEGAGYEEGMLLENYKKVQHDEAICWDNGWRRIVVEHYDIEHINISEAGSSNDRQFRLAKRFLVSEDFRDLYHQKKNIIVLWGITSVNRYDMWVKSLGKYKKLFLQNVATDMLLYGEDADHLAYALDKFSYSESARVRELELNFLYWNQYFKLLGIKNFWFDTFTSFDYKVKIHNLFDNERNKDRDLVSVIANHHKKQTNYNNFLGIDNFKYALDNNLLNPYSFHPKKEGYKLLGDYFIEKLKEYV